MKRQIKKIEKPWGHEFLFANTHQYAGKLLFIKAEQSLSLQYHEHKVESIYVQIGMLKLEVGQEGAALAEGADELLEEHVLGPGDAWHIPAQTRHRFCALEDTTLFEVSTADLDDVVRLKDRYGREGTSTP